MKAPFRKLKVFLEKDAASSRKDLIGHAAWLAVPLLTICSYYFISKMVDKNSDFFSFVFIGIVYIFYIYSIFDGFQKDIKKYRASGVLEAMTASPTGSFVILIGMNLWNICLATAEMIIFLLIGKYCLGISIGRPNIVSAVLILALSAVILISLAVISSALSFIFFKKRDPLSFLINCSVFLLCGVYFPIGLLPPYLQKVSLMIPMTYSLQGLREELMHVKPAGSQLYNIMVLAAFVAALLPLSVLVFNHAIYRLKVEGRLSDG